jgi:spore germination cell wall hydrolase CwlJ-like protein
MLKQSAALILALALAAGLPSPRALADAGDQEPPRPLSTVGAWLPDSPCADDDAICAAFVSGRATPADGVPPAIWREARCLAIMAFHEARGEGPLGMKAVIWVALNRAHADDLRPCLVIAAPGQFSPAARRHLLQAAQTGTMPRPIRVPAHAVADAEALAWARGLAWRTLMGELTLDPTRGATLFHATYVRPDWARRFSMTTQIGIHRFYRAPGPS